MCSSQIKGAELKRIISLPQLMMVGLVVIGISCLRAETFDPSLKLYFTFDEDFSNGQVVDNSGHGNHGWQFNPTNWITATNGVFGSQAAQFTIIGVMTNDPPQIYPLSQYIAVTNLNGFEYLTNATISYWVRFDGGNTNHASMYIFDCSANVKYALAPDQASNSWGFKRDGWWHDTSFFVCPATGGTRTVVTWSQDTDYATTNFNLYTLTLDCVRNEAIAYYNGRPVQTNAIDLPWIRVYGCKNRHWLCIGASSHDGTPEWGDDRYPNAGFLSGKLDDIRIYNRTLSAGEVSALTNRFVYIANIRKTDAESVRISWQTISNGVYQVESTPALSTSVWTPRGSQIQGTGGTQEFTDSVVGQPSQFYRVRLLP